MIYHSPSFDMKGFSSIGGILLTIDAAKMQAGKSPKRRLPSWIYSRLTARPRPRGERKNVNFEHRTMRRT